MAIPDYQTLMLPLLKIAEGGEEHRVRDAIEHLSREFQLTDAERGEMLPSGAAPTFNSRVGWARTYLKQAGLLTSPKRGVFQITDSGRALLAKKLERVDAALLDQYAEFRSFKARRRDAGHPSPAILEASAIGEKTPEDVLALAYQTLRKNLETDVLDQVMNSSPAFFERLVIDVLVSMGYGGSRQDAGQAIGRSGDGGIDGIIKEDKLGLDVIYIQAKRWEGSVGRPEVQKFAGALQGMRASKGVMITTSSFTRDAEQYVNTINSKIILIDGEKLAALMVDHNVGVSPMGVYETKKVDSDYFEGE